MIPANALIEKFRYALDNRWGYIWGTAGDLWTEAKQKQKVQYMVGKYGTGWKENSEAKGSNYYLAATVGSKWIGHYVADCSGLFSWAFKKLGGSIAHGSNSIYDRYCSSKGSLSNGERTDRNAILPGSAVFTDHDGDKTHIGLYVGNGTVIEAANTTSGVICSNLKNAKWKCWGELRGVSYTAQTVTEQTQEPALISSEKPTLRKGSTGSYVVLAQKELINKGYACGDTGADGIFGNDTLKAVKSFQKANGLTVDGIIGKNTWAALDLSAPAALWSVHIPHLSDTEAEALLKRYPGSTKEAERG